MENLLQEKKNQEIAFSLLYSLNINILLLQRNTITTKINLISQMNLLDSQSLLHNTNAMSFIITYSKPINDDILKTVIVSEDDRENIL
jgi:hypothetical protein